jgi:hypothetical protein
MTKPCRHCKSPARFNPCWYSIEHPEYATSGGDPPCLDDMYWDEGRERTKRRTKRFLLSALYVSVMVGVALLFRALR